MEGPSHIVFGLGGAVIAESAFHIASPVLFPLPSNPGTLTTALTQTIIYFSFATFGSLAPDIDNAQSTIGRRAGLLSKGIQHFAGHRTILHSLIGVLIAGALLSAILYGLDVVITAHLGAGTSTQLLGARDASATIHTDILIAIVAFLIGYVLHLIADSLTIGGIPWLFPNRTRYGFPPNRALRFKSGSFREPLVVIAVSVLIILGILSGILII